MDETVNLFKKQCCTCQKFKGYGLFYPHKGKKDGYNPQCKKCQKSDTYFKLYGITLAEWQDMRRNQTYKCAWCGRHESVTGPKGLGVDHCHISGKARRLLCANCNAAEGMLSSAWPEILKIIEEHAHIPLLS